MYDIRCARCLQKCYIWGKIIQSVQYTSLINHNKKRGSKLQKGQNTCCNVLYYETMEIWCVYWIFSRKNHCNRNANIFTKALLYSKDSKLLKSWSRTNIEAKGRFERFIGKIKQFERYITNLEVFAWCSSKVKIIGCHHIEDWMCLICYFISWKNKLRAFFLHCTI